jgi:hypothetical protein
VGGVEWISNAGNWRAHLSEMEFIHAEVDD